MEYIKAGIIIDPINDWIKDVISSQLGEAGFDSFVETEQGIEAYIPAVDFKPDLIGNVLDLYKNEFTFQVNTEKIEDQNWNEVWEKNYFQPLLISGECLVRAPFHKEYPRARYEIVIEPNMAFGTGNHETTSLVIEKILKEDIAGKNILDMGCGTGILSILAAMKGARKITAIDIDEWSFTGARENAEINNIQNMEVKLGDAGVLNKEKYDLIFANIQKNVLINDMQAYTTHLTEGGKIIMSGFFIDDAQQIEERANQWGLKKEQMLTKNNWAAVSFIKE